MSWRGWLLAPLLLLPVVAPAQAPWYSVQTKHLTGYAEGNEGAARDAARRGEQLLAVFSQIFHRKQIQFSVPVYIVAKRSENSPALVRTPVANYVRADLAQPESWSAAAQAITFLLLNDNYPRAQPWFDHGIASYLAGARIKGELMELGAPPPGMKLPGAAEWVPIAQFFAIPEAKASGAVYEAESFAVVRWIVGNGRQAQAGSYLNAVEARGLNPELASNESFQLSLADLDREVRESLGKPLSQSTTLPHIEDRLYGSQKMSLADANVLLANPVLFGPNSADSDAALKAMVGFMHQNQDNAAVHRSLAWAFLLKGDRENAVEHIRRALALDDGSPEMHYLYARWVNQGDADSIRVESAEARMGTELKAALRRNPNYAPAWELLGLAQLSSGAAKPAVESLQRASALAPRQSRYYFNLAQALEADGNLPAARNLMLYARSGADPELSKEVQSALDELGNEKRRRERWAEMGLAAPTAAAPGKYDNMQEAIEAEERAENTHTQPSSGSPGDSRAVEHLNGELVDVDCSAKPSATLHVSAGGSIWTLFVSNRETLLLIETDRFDCGWRNVEVSVNYKKKDKLAGDVVSLEAH